MVLVQWASNLVEKQISIAEEIEIKKPLRTKIS